MSIIYLWSGVRTNISCVSRRLCKLVYLATACRQPCQTDKVVRELFPDPTDHDHCVVDVTHDAEVRDDPEGHPAVAPPVQDAGAPTPLRRVAHEPAVLPRTAC